MERLVTLAERLKRRFIALPYDAADHRAERYYASQYMRRIEAHLSQMGPAPLRILDVGCGTGRFLVSLADLGHDLVGVDHHRDSLRRIREKTKSFGARVEIRDGSAEAVLPGLPSQSFDAVLSLEVLYTHRDRPAVMREMYRLLRPGGIGFITHRPPAFYLWQALQAGHLDDALLVQTRTEGRLRKGSHRIFNNWQTVTEIRTMHEAFGATILELVPIGPYSGFGSDPLAGVCDPGTLTDAQLDRLAEIESLAGPEMLAASRYNLAIGRKADG